MLHLEKLARYYMSVFSFCLVASALSGQEIVPTTWYMNRLGAVSLTFDDSLSGHWSHADPIMTGRGVRGTFFVITNSVDWSGARNAALNGHEIGSHSTTDSTLRNDVNGAQKMKASHDAVEAEIGKAIANYQCHTIAWPYGARRLDVVNEADYAGLYIAARNAGNSLGATNSYNAGDTGSWWKYGEGAYGLDHFFVIGDALMFADTSISKFESQLDLVESNNAWTVFTYHGIETGGYQNISAENFTAQVEAVASRMNDTLYVAPFGEIVRYIKQRDAAEISVIENTTDSVKLSVTDDLDDLVYNLPMTLKMALPDGWETVTGMQSEEPIEVWIAGEFLYFNAIPDGGEIILSSEGRGAEPIAPDKVKFVYMDDSLILTFLSIEEMTYRLQSSAGLDGPFQDLTGFDAITGDGSQKAFQIPTVPVETTYYQILVK